MRWSYLLLGFAICAVGLELIRARRGQYVLRSDGRLEERRGSRRPHWGVRFFGVLLLIMGGLAIAVGFGLSSLLGIPVRAH